MKIARYVDGSGERWGFVESSTVAPAIDAAMIDCLSDRNSLEAAQAGAGQAVALESVSLLAPVAAPPQFIGVGLNYRAHAVEAGFDIPEVPVTFPFHRSAVIGTGAPVRIPQVSSTVDWEAELAIVIGSGGKDIPVESALEHVAGYTIVNDVSARDIQWSDGQWSRAKSFDTFKPMGPWITTTDELGDAGDLEVTLTLNGEVMQHGHTSDLVFSVPELVSYISRDTTLLPGAVIATGTPAGVGMSRTPPRFLVSGDRLEIVVTGIGTLVNDIL